MQITSIGGYHLKYSPRVPLGNSRTFIRTREVLALEVKTDAGLSGWGEVFSSPWTAAALVKTKFARTVLGQSPEAFGRLYAEMMEGAGNDRRGPDATDNPLLELLGFPVSKDGTIALPDGPGLGIDLKPSMLEPWTLEHWSLAS